MLSTPPLADSQTKAKGGARVLFVYQSGQDFTLSIKPGRPLHLTFARTIKSALGKEEHPLVSIRKQGREMVVDPADELDTSTLVSVKVDFGVRVAFFDFRYEPEQTSHDELVEVIAIDRAVIEAEAHKYAEPAIEASREEHLRKRLQAEGKLAREESQGKPMQRQQLVPVYVIHNSSLSMPTTLVLHRSKWSFHSEHVLIPFDIDHRHPRPFRLASVRVTMEGEEVWAQVVQLDNAAESGSGLLARSDNNGRIRGVVAIKADAARGIKEVDIEFHEPDNGRWVKAAVSGWTVERVAFARLDPERNETAKERFFREAREEAESRARARQTIVGAFYDYGACWLTADNGSGQEEATTCHGFGLRLTYPAFVPQLGTTNLAFEVEALGGWTTSDARFEDVTFDGEQGTLDRSAWFGRTVGSLALRFGDRKISYFRLGLGMQGTRHNVNFSAGDGPGSSTEFGFILAFGGGLDLRLTDEVLLGAVVSGEGESSQMTM